MSYEKLTDYAPLSLSAGVIVAILSLLFPVSLARFLNVLAIIQATFLSIIIAIYILGNQVVLERYSPRVLEVAPDNVFTLTVALFGASIFLDLLSLLFIEYLLSSALWTFLTIWVTFSLATSTFLTLIFIKDEIVGSAQPDAVADIIRESITEDQFWEQAEEDGDSRPFYNQFEVTRSALRNDDRQDSRNILEALTDRLVNLSDSVFPPSDQRAALAFIGFMYIISELSEIGDIVVERDDKQLIKTTIETLRDISVDAVESGFDRVSSQGVSTILNISEQLVPSRVPETLVKSAWLSFSEILDPAAENDAMRTIGVTTNAISSLVADIEEESDFFDSFSDKVAEILIQTLIDGWGTYLENHGESVPVSEIGYGDPKYLSGDLLEYKHSFNHFEDHFQSCSRSIFRIFSSELGEPRIVKIENIILEGLKDLGVICAEIGNEGLTYHFSMVLVFIGVGLNYGSSNIAELLEEIFSINTTGANAVNHVFIELRNFPDHNGPSPSMYLGPVASELYDNADEFYNQLMEIEIEVQN